MSSPSTGRLRLDLLGAVELVLVIGAGLLRLAGGHPDHLFLDADQSAVGGASPLRVDGAVERPGRQGRGREWGGRCGVFDMCRLEPEGTGVGPPAQHGVHLVVAFAEARPDLHLGNVGLATEQQPGQGGIGSVVGRRPPQHHLRLGSRHRDVGQAQLLLGVLAARRALGGR